MSIDEITELILKQIGFDAESFKVGLVVKKAISDSKNTLELNDKKNLAYDLYWYYDYPVKLIADFLDVHANQVSITVGEMVVDGSCNECGADMQVTYTNRKNYTGNPYEAIGVCSDCVAEKTRIVREKALATEEQYQKRKMLVDAHRQELATMPYPEYLQTDHWKEIRKAMLRRAGYKCSLCNTKGELHVHHKTYERRGAEWYEDLIVLCHNCHAKFHNKD